LAVRETVIPAPRDAGCMRIAVVGGGAMGSLFAALLTRAGHDVSLLDRSAERADAAREGVRVERPDGTAFTVPVAATTEGDSLHVADLLVVAVKSYDTAAAVADAAPAVGPDTAVLTLQNGLGNAETVAEAVPEERVLAGTTAHGATLLGPGRVRHAGTGPTRVGRYFAANDDRVAAVADALTRAGVETTVVDDVRDAIWAKVAVNAGVNPVTALADVDNGALSGGVGDRLLAAAVREAAAVARAVGRDVPDSTVDDARAVVESTAANRSSMHADLAAGRRTEVEAINGAVVEAGEAHGVPVPVNRTLADLVRLASGYSGDGGDVTPTNGGSSR